MPVTVSDDYEVRRQPKVSNLDDWENDTTRKNKDGVTKFIGQDMSMVFRHE